VRDPHWFVFSQNTHMLMDQSCCADYPFVTVTVKDEGRNYRDSVRSPLKPDQTNVRLSAVEPARLTGDGQVGGQCSFK